MGQILIALWAAAVAGMMISSLTENLYANLVFLLAGVMAMCVAYMDQQGQKRKPKK